MTIPSWIVRPKRLTEEDVPFSPRRVRPDRSNSSSRPRPPPLACFAVLTKIEDISLEKEFGRLTTDDDGSAVDADCSSMKDSEQSPSKITPPPSVERMKNARRPSRRNSLLSSTRLLSFFDSGREGDVKGACLV